MAYDEALADRLRSLLAGRDDVTEKRMFGGLAFLVGGHMAVAASRTGGLLVRVDPAEGEALAQQAHVEPMVMRDRPMDGWLVVAAEALEAPDALEPWLARAVTYVEALPRKR